MGIEKLENFSENISPCLPSYNWISLLWSRYQYVSRQFAMKLYKADNYMKFNFVLINFCFPFSLFSRARKCGSADSELHIRISAFSTSYYLLSAEASEIGKGKRATVKLWPPRSCREPSALQPYT